MISFVRDIFGRWVYLLLLLIIINIIIMVIYLYYSNSSLIVDLTTNLSDQSCLIDASWVINFINHDDVMSKVLA